MNLFYLPFFALSASALFQYCIFWSWPGAPDADVVHSIFAAQNWVANGSLRSINLYPPNSDDLSVLAQTYWMTHWPPAHSWLYSITLLSGLSPGAATKFFGLCCIIIGGVGWVKLLTKLGASTSCSTIAAVAWPWLSFMARIYIDYKNDHVACALMPWICGGIIQVAQSSALESRFRTAFVAFLSGSVVLVKYSLVPVLGATALYLLWSELSASSRRIQLTKTFLFFVFILLLPGVCLGLVNFLWSRHSSYPLQAGVGVDLAPLQFLKNIIVNTIAAPTGWQAMLTQSSIILDILFSTTLFPGSILAMTLALLVLWFVFIRSLAWSAVQIRFAWFVSALTVITWAFVCALSVFSGVKYDFTSDSRFYFPAGFAWLTLAAVAVDKWPEVRKLRAACLASLLAPIFFSGAFNSYYGIVGPHYSAMPNSHIWWQMFNVDAKWHYGEIGQSHANFLSDLVQRRGRRPDIIFTRQYSLMVELEAPIYWDYASARIPAFRSSRPIEAWAVIKPTEGDLLRAKIGRASSIESIETPLSYPFKVYILKFED